MNNLVSLVKERQADRITLAHRRNEHPDEFLLLREDLLGPRPDAVRLHGQPWPHQRAGALRSCPLSMLVFATCVSRCWQALLESSKAWQELKAMEGLQPVKHEVRRILDAAIENAAREEREEVPIPANLNRIFMGNPGTGAPLSSTPRCGVR